MTRSKSHKPDKLLLELLSALVRHWGAEAVRHALEAVEVREIHTDPSGRASDLSARNQSKRLTPRDVVAKLDIPEARKRVLSQLADQFERKQFLPSVGDIRNFLMMRGSDVPNLKQRSEAFKRVLVAISDLPDERLEKLAREGRHSGPSQLGPLSDAIQASSAAARSGSAPSGASDASRDVDRAVDSTTNADSGENDAADKATKSSTDPDPES